MCALIKHLVGERQLLRQDRVVLIVRLLVSAGILSSAIIESVWISMVTALVWVWFSDPVELEPIEVKQEKRS